MPPGSPAGWKRHAGKLESAAEANPARDPGLRYDAACAYALASHADRAANPAKSSEQAARAIGLLKEAIRLGYSDYAHIQEDADLDPIRGLPAMAEILNAGRLDRRYSAVWSNDFRFEAIPIYGLDPASQYAECRKLIGQGFRPLSISVTATVPDLPPVTASCFGIARW